MRTSYIMPITGSFSSHMMRLPWPACVLLSAERPRYEFSATVLRRICNQRFSL